MITFSDKKLFSSAKRIIPGGVNSPVRSFKSVGGYPIFIKKGSGSTIISENNRTFIDYCLSWGALILGHTHKDIVSSLRDAIHNGTSFGANTKLEIELAQRITQAVPSIKQVRLVNSGTEAVMSAIRLARAYTKKNKIVKFEGSYHGHADYLLTRAGSGLASLGVPGSLGVPYDFVKNTVVAPFNNIKTLKKVLTQHRHDLAAIIVEPVAANCGVIPATAEFLTELRTLTRNYNIVLIFDEVVTGFRLSYGGAQEFFGITPDLTCFGKILGGGLPIGAFGGKKEIMKLLAPQGKVYQAGTLSGNPLSVTAGIATLKKLKESKPYNILAKKTKRLCEGIKLFARKEGITIQINYIGSMFSLFFTKKKVIDYATAHLQNVSMFKRLYHGLLQEGIYFSPSGFETNFLSTAHTADDVEKTLRAFEKLLKAKGGKHDTQR